MVRNPPLPQRARVLRSRVCSNPPRVQSAPYDSARHRESQLEFPGRREFALAGERRGCQTLSSELQDSFHLLSGQAVIQGCELVDREAVLQVFENGRHRNSRPAENPSSAESSRHTFYGRAFRPILRHWLLASRSNDSPEFASSTSVA